MLSEGVVTSHPFFYLLILCKPRRPALTPESGKIYSPPGRPNIPVDQVLTNDFEEEINRHYGFFDKGLSAEIECGEILNGITSWAKRVMIHQAFF